MTNENRYLIMFPPDVHKIEHIMHFSNHLFKFQIVETENPNSRTFSMQNFEHYTGKDRMDS